MSEALVTLATSLRFGRNSKHIQYDTMRKTRTWLNNAHVAGQECSCKTVVGWTNPSNTSLQGTLRVNGLDGS